MVFVLVLVEQQGLPLPAVPMLLGLLERVRGLDAEVDVRRIDGPHPPFE